jgi:hypothetical protein
LNWNQAPETGGVLVAKKVELSIDARRKCGVATLLGSR